MTTTLTRAAWRKLEWTDHDKLVGAYARVDHPDKSYVVVVGYTSAGELGRSALCVVRNKDEHRNWYYDDAYEQKVAAWKELPLTKLGNGR